MDKDEKIEERKKRNAPFLRVFDYLAKEKMMNQGQFAKVIDSESGYISLLRSGIKRVGADYIARIAAVFALEVGNFSADNDFIAFLESGTRCVLLIVEIKCAEYIELIFGCTIIRHIESGITILGTKLVFLFGDDGARGD